MDTIRLEGRKRQLLRYGESGFIVKSGSVQVALQPYFENKPVRRMYLGTAEIGDWIPSPYEQYISAENGKQLVVAYFLSSDEGAEIEKVSPKHEQSENIRSYLNRSIFTLVEKTGSFNAEEDNAQIHWDKILAMYKKRVDREKEAIASRKEENRLINRKVNHSLLSVFGSRFHYQARSLEREDQGLYDAAAFLCFCREIECVSYRKLKKSCGDRYHIDDIARLSGFPIRRITLPQNIKKCSENALLCFLKKDKTERPAVVYTRLGKQYLHDPKSGVDRLLTEEDWKGLNPEAVIFDRPLGEESVTLKEMVHFCIKEISASDIVLLAVCALILARVGVAFSQLNRQVYGEIIPSGKETLAFGAGMVFLAVIISSFLFSIAQSLTDYRLGMRLRSAIQLAVFHRVFHLPENFFHNREGAAQAYRINMLSSTYSSLIKTGMSICLQIIFTVNYLFGMFSFSKPLSMTGLVAAVLQVLITVIFGILMQKTSRERNTRTAQIRSFIYQALSGIGTIRMAGAENAVLGQYMDREVLLQRNQKKSNSLNALFSALISVVSYSCVVIFYSMIGNGQSLNINLGVFMGFISVNTMFTKSLTEITNGILMFHSMKPLLKDAGEYLSIPPELNNQGIILKELGGDISLSHVTFSYSGSKKNVVDDLSVHIHQGEYIGIAGYSGCGKSTLLRLILGFEEPTDGQVYFDNIPMKKLNLPELRQKIGTVLQDGSLIAGDLYENITVSDPDATWDQVHQAVETVGLTKEIDAMPMGLMTHVSEETLTISGGQKQRILIARAIVGKPRILLLDEATSSLDNLSQEAISEALKDLHATRIVVAHRLSTLRLCDRILVMDQGKIVEEGTYEDLIEKKGRFYEMVQIQQAV